MNDFTPFPEHRPTRLTVPGSSPPECSYRLEERTAAGLLQGIRPRQQLLIFGAGPDVTPLATLAVNLGWHTAVVVHPGAEPPDLPWRCRVLTLHPEMEELPFKTDAQTAAVVMTHYYGHDLAWMARLTRKPLQYLGLPGPLDRCTRILDVLSEAGIMPEHQPPEHLYVPAGLDIGAEGTEEIALSVISEIKAVSAGRSGGSLRNRAQSSYRGAKPSGRSAK